MISSEIYLASESLLHEFVIIVIVIKVYRKYYHGIVNLEKLVF